MMRSNRVREETPQPTMRVTDGSSALSMIYKDRTRGKISDNYIHISVFLHTNIHQRNIRMCHPVDDDGSL